MARRLTSLPIRFCRQGPNRRPRRLLKRSTGRSAIGWFFVALALLALEGPVRRLAGLYASGFRLQGLGMPGAVALSLGGAALGWLGSGIAAARNMRRIEPGRND